MEFHARTLAVALMAMVFTVSGRASDSEDMPARNKFTNIGFSYSKLKQDGMPELKSDIGVNFTKGTTYFLHKPIAHRLRFGIDAVWTDINYSNYKVTYIDPEYPEYPEKTTMHEVEIGLQVGPSVNFNIHRNSELHAYFRYAPSFSGFYNGDEFQAGFGNFFVGGASVSWKFIGAGIEARFGSSKYKQYLSLGDFGYDDYEDTYVEEQEEESGSDKVKTKFHGCRAYITFRF